MSDINNSDHEIAKSRGSSVTSIDASVQVNMLDVDNLDYLSVPNHAESIGSSVTSIDASVMSDIDNLDYETAENNSDSDEEHNNHILRQTNTTTLFNIPGISKTEEMARDNYNHDNTNIHGNDVDNNDDNHQEEVTTLKETCKYALFYIFEAIAFLFFMLYWIVKEPILRTVTLFYMILSTVVVEPLLYISSLLTSNEDWIPGPELRERVTMCFTLIFLSLLCIPLYKYTNFYPLGSIDPSSFGFSLSNPLNANLMETLASLQQENMMLWNNIKNSREQLLKHETLLCKQYMFLNGIEGIVRNTIENELPEQIFIESDKNGQLELSSSFIASFQSSSIWNEFIKKNDLLVKKMIDKYVEDYIHQKKEDGAIVSKQMFMKLLSDKLLLNQDPSEDANLNFQSLINSALMTYHQDVLNKADFALVSRGAYSPVALTSLTWSPLPVWVQSLLNFAAIPSTTNPPEMALTPDNHAGACWRMYGDNGTFGISLSEKIRVKAIAIEYPSKEVMVDMSSAPKNVQIFGIEDLYKETELWNLLGDFEYDINKGEPIQLFDTIDLPTSFKVIVVKIKSNWGHKEYTDLYRVRVHGEPML